MLIHTIEYNQSSQILDEAKKKKLIEYYAEWELSQLTTFLNVVREKWKKEEPFNRFDPEVSKKINDARMKRKSLYEQDIEILEKARKKNYNKNRERKSF